MNSDLPIPMSSRSEDERLTARAKNEIRAADAEDSIEKLQGGLAREAVGASIVTAAVPVAYLIEAIYFWSDGWPGGGIVIFTMMVIASIGMWQRVLVTRNELTSIRHELETREANHPSDAESLETS